MQKRLIKKKLWREGFQNSKKLYVIIQNKMRANFSYGKKDMNLTGVGGGVGLVGGRAGRMGGGGAVGDSLIGGGGGI